MLPNSARLVARKFESGFEVLNGFPRERRAGKLVGFFEALVIAVETSLSPFSAFTFSSRSLFSRSSASRVTELRDPPAPARLAELSGRSTCRLMMHSNFVACCTGRSAAWLPQTGLISTRLLYCTHHWLCATRLYYGEVRFYDETGMRRAGDQIQPETESKRIHFSFRVRCRFRSACVGARHRVMSVALKSIV